MPHVVTGAVTGLVWFVALSMVEAQRISHLNGPPGAPWLALVGALVACAVATAMLLRLGVRFRAGVAAGLAVCVLAGFLLGADPLTTAPPDLLAIPWTFTRGAVSTAVWAALGVTAVMTGLAVRRQPETATDPVHRQART